MRTKNTLLQTAMYSSILSIAVILQLSGCQKNVDTLSDAAGSSTSDSNRLTSNASTEKIAFQSDREGNNNFEIYVMSPDGSGQTRLTNSPGWDTDAAWSPDRSKITFMSNRDGNWNIYVMNADGTNLKRLTSDPGDDTHPEWSPNGSKIIFGSNRLVTPWGSRVGGIYTMNTDGSDVKAVIPPNADYVPDWSPDGRKIVFHSLREGADIYPTADIWVMNADGSGLTRLTDKNDGFDGYPQWSLDGSRLLFVHEGSIWIMNADGSGKKKLGNGNQPAWSPDGRQITFIDSRDGGPCCQTGVYNVEVYTMNADGSAVKRLTNNPAFDQSPAWAR